MATNAAAAPSLRPCVSAAKQPDVAAEATASAIAIRLAALAEGLAYYVLIGAVSADAARREVLHDIARLHT